jgi:hypothetical protein
MCQRNYYYYYYYYYYYFIIIIIIIMYSSVNTNFNFLGIIIKFLPLYRLWYFVFCSFNYFCVFLCTRSNFVIGLCALKFARK